MYFRLLTILLLFKVLPVMSQYCIPTFNGQGDNIGITQMELKNINRISVAEEGYVDATTQVDTLNLGGVYSLKVTTGANNQNITAAIDYDLNGSFSLFFPNEWLGQASATTAGITSTINFTVPITVNEGLTRLRVSEHDPSVDPIGNLALGCFYSIDSGDVEDYSIYIRDTLPMLYVSSTTFHNDLVSIAPAGGQKLVLGIKILTKHPASPFDAQSITVNFNGTTNLGAIANAQLWFTGNDSCFSAINQFGATLVAPSGSNTFMDSETLVRGANYFWLTVDVTGGNPGDYIDGECTQINLGGSNYAPTVTVPPGDIRIDNQTNYRNKRSNIWYLNEYFGIDFNSQTPHLLRDPNPNFNTSEGSGTICDENGNLLFYAHEDEVYNRCHKAMPNSKGFVGTFSKTSMQTAMIIPKPGNPDIYYIFLLDQGLSYVAPTIDTNKGSFLFIKEVDMALDGGMGDVVLATKNMILDSHATQEVITAVRHCNGVDYWVITGKHGTYDFKAWLINSSGIQPPIRSSVPWGTEPMHKKGSFKLSPNGKKMVYSPIFREYPTLGLGTPVLFDFDNSSGIVSNPQVLSTQNGGSASFSPDNSKLYLGNSGNGRLYQYDLCNPPLTRVQVGDNGSGMWLMQLAPDGKIYTTRESSSDESLGEIQNPNALGVASNFTTNGFELTGASGLLGGSYSHLASTHVESRFNESVFLAGMLGFLSDTVCFQDTTSFIDTTPVLAGCDVLPRNYYWDFGDPASGLANNSILQHPKHLFSAPGIYSVMFAIEEGCQRDTIFKQVVVNALPIVSLGNDTDICTGDSLILDAIINNNATYLWQDGSTDSTFTVNITGIYDVSVTNTDGCIGRDTISVTLINGDATIIPAGPYCLNDLVDTLKSVNTGGVWMGNGVVDSIFSPSVAGVGIHQIIYSICGDADTISIFVTPIPQISLVAETVICGGSIELAVTSADSGLVYLWSTGESTSTITVSTVGSYAITATNTICSATDTINVNSCSIIYIPNSFSPNGDGFNDVFQIRGEGIDNIVIKIYDRWGNGVFETTDINQSWDGKHKGKQVSKGVYVYHITGVFTSKDEFEQKGNISLVK